MKVYPPGEVPDWVTASLSELGKKQVERCYASVAKDGTCFFSVHYDHVMIVLIIGTASRAFMPLRAYHHQGLPIFFLGHTPHVIEWGKKYCEEVGVLFRYKES